MKYALLFLINIFSFNVVLAQVQSSSGFLGNYGPPSPEAASLGKYIDHPVGYYTGTPIINIPLFEIVAGRIKVPISLSYHASGVKIDEISSRVGTGFSLNAGGVVSTVVKGLPDDGIGCYFDRNPNQWMFPGEDLEPDVHYYKFGAKQGKIYFENRTTAATIDNDPVKIVGPYNGDKKFIITTEEGIIYKFEAVEGNRQIITQGQSGYMFTSNSYYLTEIEDPVSSQKVKFIYRTDMPATMSYVNKRSGGASILYCNLANPVPTDNDSFILGAKVLQRIEYTGGFIEFKADHIRLDLIGDRAYTEINQYGHEFGLGTPILKKGFNLSYGYTINGNTVEGRRLYLETIKEKGTDGTFLPPYVFSYKNRDALPPRNSYQQDVWGFYNANGVITSTSYPKVYVYNNAGKCSYLPIKIDGLGTSSTVAGIDKSSNPLTIDYGVLNKVVYPTKGYTTYDYEPHMFGYDTNYGIHPISFTFKQGGIRIKEITDFSANGELLLHKNYYYYLGHLGGPLPQVAVPTSGYYAYFQFSQNQSLLGNCQGSYVGYEGVIEIVNEQSGKKSATVYHYSKDSDVEGFVEVNTNYCSDFSNLTNIRRDTFFPFFEMESREARRGLLLKQEFFNDYVGIQEEQPIKKIEYTYNLWSHPIASIKSTYDAGNSAIILYGSRSLNQEKMLMTSKTETEYVASGDSISRQTTYTYTTGAQDGQFLRTQTISESDAENLNSTITTRYTYPFDYAATASGGAMGEMVTMNNISPIINEVKTNITNPYQNNQIVTYIGAKVTNYKKKYSFSKPILTEEFQLKSALASNAINDPLVNITDPSNPGLKYEKRVEFTYDQGFMPSIIEHDKKKEYYQWSLLGDVLLSKSSSESDSWNASYLLSQSWSLEYDPNAKTGTISYVWDGGLTDIPFFTLDGIHKTTISFWAKGGSFHLGYSGESPIIVETAPVDWKYYCYVLPTDHDNFRDATISLFGSARMDEFSIVNGDFHRTLYGYDKFQRLQYTISPEGRMTSYEYDAFSRLKNVKDDKGNIIKSYDYNYKTN